MLTIENAQVFGFQAAIRGMRNPKNSWAKGDSTFELSTDESGVQMIDIGPADLKLAGALANSGPDDGKFLRMIHVQLDVTAPLYWWKEADQYKVGTVTDSCSTICLPLPLSLSPNFSHYATTCTKIILSRGGGCAISTC